METFAGKETEENWVAREKLLRTLLSRIEDEKSAVLTNTKPYLHDILALCSSPRTQLALTACRFVGELASNLEEYGDYYWVPSLTTLLKVCSSAKKVMANAAEIALRKVFLVMPMTKILYHVHLGVTDKNVHLRERVVESFSVTLVSAKANLAKRHWPNLEPVIIKIISDPSPVVRSAAAKIMHTLDDPFSVEIKKMIDSLDCTTAKQLRQALTSWGELASSPNRIIANEAIPISEPHGTDDEVIIPMQQIPIEQEYSCSHIPVINSKADKTSLLFCTPYRNKLAANHNLSYLSASSSRFSLETLLTQLAEPLIPKAIWKRIEMHIDAYPNSFSSNQIRLILDTTSNRFADIGYGQIGSVGLIIKRVFTIIDIESIPFDDWIVKLLIRLNEFYHANSALWINPPFYWLPLNRNGLLGLLSFIENHPSDAVQLLEFLDDKLSLEESSDISTFVEILSKLHQVWCISGSSSIVRPIVSCITKIRVRVGEAVFFQSLPLLTIPQKDLLNIYLTMSLP